MAVDWFERCVGDWTSHRRYLYGKELTEDCLVTKFDIVKTGDNTFKLSWGSDRNTGEMNFTIEDDVCHRDIGYYTSAPTDSKIDRIDEDTICFNTSYGGTDYREEIRLLDNDNIRLRQTVGWRNGKVNVVGQYYEVKDGHTSD